jgi:hypothetical protein
MFSLSLKGVSVSAPTLEEMETMLANLPRYAELVAKAGFQQAAEIPKVASNPLALRGPNVTKFLEVTGGKRFRMSDEDIALYGDTPEGRENCAIARLVARGESAADGTEKRGEGVSASEAGEIEGLDQLDEAGLDAIHDDDDEGEENDDE